MEELKEYLLKNGWVRSTDIPPSTQGEPNATLKSNLDKWLDDFGSNNLKPVCGIEANKDGHDGYIENILAMMSTGKRIPQPNRAMVETTNIRENLLKRGWFVAPGEGRDAFATFAQPLAQKKVAMLSDTVVENVKEPKDDIERLLIMLASKKAPAKTGKGRGSVDLIKLQVTMLNMGWFIKNDKPRTSGGTSASDTPVSDRITNLDKWFMDYEDGHLQCNEIKRSEIPAATNNDVDKILNMLSSKKTAVQAKGYQGTTDISVLRKKLLTKGWYALPGNKLNSLGKVVSASDIGNTLENGLTTKTQALDTKIDITTESSSSNGQHTETKDIANGSMPINNTGDVPERKHCGISKKTRDYRRANAVNNSVGNSKNKLAEEMSPKNIRRHERDISKLIQHGWSVANKSKHQISVVKIPETTPMNVISGGIMKGDCGRKSCASRKSRKDKFEDELKRKTLLKDTLLESKEKKTPVGTENEAETCVTVADVSHKKKSLVRRFVRRSRKLMGRLFTCGKREE